MEELVTFRISSDLRAEMKKYRINWSERMRQYLETQIKQLELLEFLDKTKTKTKREKMHADSTRFIREYRDSR